ncbi:MAG: TolC family protein [Firmicutes bacterium]|nr:TolC family protein [Bacillota bacterium]
MKGFRRRWSFGGALLALALILAGTVPAGAQDEQPVNLDLHRAVELALEHNVQLALARREVEAAETALAQARASALISPSPATLLQAEAGLRLAQRSLALTEQNVAYEVESAYYDVLRLENLLAVLDDSLEASRRQLEVAKSRRDAGVATDVDVLRAQTSLLELEANRAQVLDNLALATARLLQVIGLPAGTEVVLDGNVVTGEAVELSLQEALAEGLENRLELAQARIGVEVAEKELELSTNDYTPELNRAQAAIKLEQAKLQLVQAEQGITLDIMRAYNEMQDAYRRLDVSRQRLAEMEENWRVVQALFEAGMATDLEVLEAQTGLTDARTGAVNAVFDYNVARAEFFQAIAREMNDR